MPGRGSKKGPPPGRRFTASFRYPRPRKTYLVSASWRALYRLDIPARLELRAEKSSFLYGYRWFATLGEASGQPKLTKSEGANNDRMPSASPCSGGSSSVFFYDGQYLHPRGNDVRPFCGRVRRHQHDRGPSRLGSSHPHPRHRPRLTDYD